MRLHNTYLNVHAKSNPENLIILTQNFYTQLKQVFIIQD